MNFKPLALSCLLAVSAPAWANGPTGLGPLQIGLTKAQVEALPQTGIHPTTPLAVDVPPANLPVKMKPGEERFKTTLQTPWQDAPLEASLTFQDDKLSSIYVGWDNKEHIVKTVTDQITEKFGQPSIADRIKTERCPSGGGSSMELKNGSLDYSWKQIKDGKEVRTRTGTTTFYGCLDRSYGLEKKVLSSVSVYTVDITPNPF